jgi:hypothetical protein
LVETVLSVGTVAAATVCSVGTVVGIYRPSFIGIGQKIIGIGWLTLVDTINEIFGIG